MISLRLHGYFCWNFIQRYFQFSRFFFLRLRINSEQKWKLLKSDNAKENLDKSFIEFFFAQNGILHQSSYAYTPQHNRVAERKNRHLLDIAKTLLFHRQVLKESWSDAILTTCYLINRMPSSILITKIPFSIIYPDCLLCLLRFFLSMCFVHNHSPHKAKLDSRSLKEIFLGYSRSQKGYKCYCPSPEHISCQLMSPFSNLNLVYHIYLRF